MSRRDATASRVEAQLGRMNWALAADVAKEINLSTGTVREYLYRLVAQGRAERRLDPDVRNPATGHGAFRFRQIDPPLPPPTPTSDLLCPTCIQREYGDELRYLAVLPNRDLHADAEGDAEYDAFMEEARCDRCGQLRFPLG